MFARFFHPLILVLFLSLIPLGAINAQIPSPLLKEAMAKKEVEEPKAVGSLGLSQLERLKNPRETMRTFMTAMNEVKNGTPASKEYFELAISTLDLSFVSPELKVMTGKKVAEWLINTIDRMAKVDFTNIPTEPDSDKWYFRKQTIEAGNEILEVEIALTKGSDGAWRFSPETVKTIEKLYSTVSHLKVVDGVVEYKNWRTKLKSLFPIRNFGEEEFFLLTKGQWLGFLIIFTLGIIALSFVRFVSTIYIRKIVRKESLNFKEEDHYKLTLPFGLLAFSLVGMGGVYFLELDLSLYVFLFRTFYILVALTSVWSSLKIVDFVTMHFEKLAKDTQNKFDDVLVPMLSKSSKVLVVAFGAILVAHSLTFDIGNILAGLGIGGVAIALAAKDTISNLFGSVTVIIDRPFLIGDFVTLDKGLEGTVEEVGFRSTRIRTPYQSLVSLPNNVLANMAIDNYGMRPTRRFKTFLQLDYSNPLLKIEEFCERLRYLCQIHPLIDAKNSQVFVYDMSESSISVLFNIFFVTTDGMVELEERHRVILEILKIAEEIGVSFAFPTRKVFMESIIHENATNTQN